MDEKLKVFWAKLNSSFSDLWANNKLFLLVFGVLIVIVKFRQVLIGIIVAGSKRLLESTANKDSRLAMEEEEAKRKADELVKKAQEEPNQEKPVDENWHKNE